MRNMPRLNGTKDVVAYVTGNFQERSIQPEEIIAKSWQRSLLNYGLDPHSPQDVEVITNHEIKQHLERHESYLNIARNGLTGLSKRISAAGFSVLLTDESGLTLDAKLPLQMKDIWQDAGILIGSKWGEKNAGTNGIGTCLIEKESMIIHQHEHFFDNHKQLSCSVTPIFDPLGNLKGCLNASCLGSRGSKESQFLTLQMVMMYGRMIENSYFRQIYRSQVTMHIKETKNFSDLAQEQLIAVNERGVIIGANRAAFAEYEGLLLPGQQLLGCQIEDITGLTINELLSKSNGGANTVHNQSPKLLDEIEVAVRVPAGITSPQVKPENKQTARSNKHKHPTLEQLAGEDLDVLQNVQQIRHVIDKDIPILITGETGTGKEAFARAIHDASAKKNGPFIALNCAAIPESLIESELFGYRSGSFTGANRKGMKGKLEQANGGTIFLDEIGDMPVQLQTRLLRALAEREILALGASEPTSLDIQVISATHQNLIQRIKDKLFREDFYYRLNGMALKLPALRLRSDKEFIIRCILDSELGGSEDVTFSPEVTLLLNDYHWPGNIRQLANVLRYSLAVSQNKHITVDDLPIEVRANKDLFKEGEIVTENEESKAMSLSDFVSDEEGRRLLETLRRLRWNITQVSEELNICRSTVYRKMKKYNIEQPNNMY